jgi:hypothetical protein
VLSALRSGKNFVRSGNEGVYSVMKKKRMEWNGTILKDVKYNKYRGFSRGGDLEEP